MHGEGIMNFANGEKYTGDWCHGLRTGTGVYIFSNGDRYELRYSIIALLCRLSNSIFINQQYCLITISLLGQWKENRTHGKGIWLSANGDRYE